ncbi:nitrophenyl compound nitroreductase subunit ArsF family protein [Maribellus sp. YY47]|uniref:nitrophenyl compound nitroreductase subunit ArsF family protein n=1 Tax=Maribellus sp. YY47 TaxID=2929486 RepID=UPI002001144B|nr:nitrophenyl compound nitroreductase subunit ArsF family protein [Maribellus sp. YY47]MCK3684257.1 nitrophenyl compound nitroreductase subunit ArsF family protein [Maribellus sp. YY47]
MSTKINIALLSLCAVLLFGIQVSAQTDSGKKETKEATVKVYYFHLNSRCATCKAIESEAQQDVKELFGSQVSFDAYNLDKPEGEAKGKELGVNSQSLIVMKGNKKIDLTNQGFLYARTDPAKFKKVIEEKIKPLL